ncbi:hypothetical protein AMEX_G22307 [Astyanax mexicanus]|uniref:Secreted protein n=1 Tax=Astyanax mexicanus TaxID=7994 RepID=A0A8T2L2C2_ASTMX|nr:hypothetical protein AMEX_G22307 [Astyanax mexicanus]
MSFPVFFFFRAGAAGLPGLAGGAPPPFPQTNRLCRFSRARMGSNSGFCVPLPILSPAWTGWNSSAPLLPSYLPGLPLFLSHRVGGQVRVLGVASAQPCCTPVLRGTDLETLPEDQVCHICLQTAGSSIRQGQ